MKGLLFYLVYIFIWLITLLPLRILYLLSDFLYLIAYYIVRYRRKTTFGNLRESIPDKTPDEIHRIAKTFYRQLTDYFIEWMYRIHMGEKELSRRLVYNNPGIFEKYRKEGRSIMLLLSHHGNWEWPTRIPQASGYKTLAIYKPLQNKYFDSFFLRLRGKFGAVGVPMESSLRSIIKHQQSGIPILVYTIADQRPQYRSIEHWSRFLNQEAPVITGPEKIAKKFNMVTIFLHIDRVKRGYYEAEFHVISENLTDLPEFTMTRKYLGMLENAIRNRPDTHPKACGWVFRLKENLATMMPLRVTLCC